MNLNKRHITELIKKTSLLLFVIVFGTFFFAGTTVSSLLGEMELDYELCEVLTENDVDEKEIAEESDDFPTVFHPDTRNNSQTSKSKLFFGTFGFYAIIQSDAYEVPHPPPDKCS